MGVTDKTGSAPSIVDIPGTDYRTAVVICALGLEAKEVVYHLQNTHEAVSPHKIVYECGHFHGRISWTVAVSECGAGNHNAAHFVLDAIHHFSPDLVLFVGVAGGLKQDVKLGDVVVASKVYGYHSGKSELEFKPRPILEYPSIGLEQRARFICRHNDWIERVRSDDRDIVEIASAHVAPIAAGEQVVASELSETYRLVREHYSDALGIEMEGYGFLSAARFGEIPAIVIRGISDLCEGKSQSQDKNWQPKAAANAAAFAFELLSMYEPPTRLISFPQTPVPDAPSEGQRDTSSDDEESIRIDRDSSQKKDLHQRQVETLRNSGIDLRRNVVRDSNWIPRSAEMTLKHISDNADSRLICLLGPPGSGKTALLARFAQSCLNEGIPTLAIKADLAERQQTFEEFLNSQTGLESPVLQSISQLAAMDRVIIVIDQIDALANLVDLHSERLNELLSFIVTCLTCRNVWVVCSCREFEFRHDVRLTALEPQELELKLPDWDQVQVELEKAGITNSSEWPTEFRDILRTPQHLKVFLRNYSLTDDMDISMSYQQMLDELWEQNVTTSRMRKLIEQLTDYLTDSEILWAPLSKYEDYRPEIDDLEAVGILKRERLQLGFSHQTLLEHSRARQFVQHHHSLSVYVIDRQNAVFVRPTLWHVLKYLREADTSRYEDELSTIFASDLRLHIRYLLIDFLGQQSTPREHEVVHLAKRLSEQDDRHRVLIAIRGNESWFNKFKTHQLPAAMQWVIEDSGYMVAVIQSAWEFAREDCLLLIKKYWLSDPEKDNLTIHAFLDLHDWDETAVDMVCQVARRSAGPDRNWWCESIAKQIANENPTLAPRFVFDTLKKQSDVIKDRSRLESQNDWNDLPAIATAAPKEFLEQSWEWMVNQAIEHHNTESAASLNIYRGWNSLFDAWTGHPLPVFDSIRIAVEAISNSDPETFDRITRASWGVENSTVQTLIAIGLTASAAQTAEIALEFLLSDPRRLRLGDYTRGDHAFSKELIREISPQLSDEQLSRLESCILSWSEYRDDSSLSGDKRNWTIEDRLRLLDAIPKSLQSEGTKKYIETQSPLHPNWTNEGHPPIQSGFVKEIPPMTKEELKSASVNEIVSTLSNSREARPPSKWSEENGELVSRGGTHAALRELQELAKEEPHRVFPAIRKLMESEQPEFAGEILHSMESSPATNEELFNLILEISKTEALPEDYRSNVSYTLYRRSQDGLSNEICDLLEKWLEEPWDSEYSSFARSENSNARDLKLHPRSILWNSSGGIIDTDKSFWTLLALTQGLMCQKPSNSERWLSILESQLQRDISQRTWEPFCSKLRWLNHSDVDADRGQAVVRELFERFPNIKFTAEGVILVANLSHKVLSEKFLRWFLKELWDRNDDWVVQAYGELLSFLAHQRKNSGWAKILLDERLNALNQMDPDQSEPFLAGAAFAASHAWDYPEFRSRSVMTIAQIAPHATERISYALSEVFWAQEDYPDDENTEMLLRSFRDNPQAISNEAVSDLIVHLASLCQFQPEIVLELTKNIVEKHGRKFGDLSTALFKSGADVVNIAMTLQRFKETRSAGLDLLEELLRLGIGDAFTILSDIDMRPVKGTKRTGRTRRRRKQSK